ncbi:flagellar assembly protein FliH [Paenibacillus thermoaerophilus]|uniref:Flagellar assembly protein FliH n=1 Tax=Paenibacillus thermoaerophilus TaxID=1215385 RepID=A0ABW2V3X7_9BACL|nr:flagellar assembly protein FliH [Paenibacillus thermoaerophilus]TMV13794.1 flagellar assembly protein FliH [Paenibacillus thermoaerophilus]
MSKIIKTGWYVAVDESRKIAPPPAPVVRLAEEEDPKIDRTAELLAEAKREAEEVKRQLIADAEAAAEEHLRQAAAEIAAAREQANAEMEAWWKERREQDERISEEIRQEGYRQGYEEGYAKAERDVLERYNAMLEEAAAIISQAAEQKQKLILEAEPFLVELSTAIAEKIIAKQLTIEPDWIIDLVRTQLARRKENGMISLYVSPKQYAFVEAARDELLMAIDSQAELAIVPDPSVQDNGCVIRSAFGSIDARIATQLEEIKQALVRLAARKDDEP